MQHMFSQQRPASEPVLRLCRGRSRLALTDASPDNPYTASALSLSASPTTPAFPSAPLDPKPATDASEFDKDSSATSSTMPLPVNTQTLEGMTATILTALREKEDQGRASKATTMKRPASADHSDSTLTKKAALGKKAAPQDQLEDPPVGKRPPLKVGQATVYFNDAKQCWRVKACPGDRVDKPVSWRGDLDQRRQQWAKVLAHCKGE